MKLLNCLCEEIENNGQQHMLQQKFQLDINFNLELYINNHANTNGGITRPICDNNIRTKGCYNQHEVELITKSNGKFEISDEEIYSLFSKIDDKLKLAITSGKITPWDGKISNMNERVGGSIFNFYSKNRRLNGTAFLYYDPTTPFNLFVGINNLRRISYQSRDGQLKIIENIEDSNWGLIRKIGDLGVIKNKTMCNIPKNISSNDLLFNYIYDNSIYILNDIKNSGTHTKIFGDKTYNIGIEPKINIKTINNLLSGKIIFTFILK